MTAIGAGADARGPFGVAVTRSELIPAPGSLPEGGTLGRAFRNHIEATSSDPAGERLAVVQTTWQGKPCERVRSPA